MINKLAKWVVRHPSLIILIAVLLLVPSLIGYVCTGINYDILSFLPNQTEPGEIEDSNAVYGLNIIDDVFESASTSVVIVENLPGKEINKVRDKIADIEGVAQVVWVGSVADISIPTSMYPDALKEMLYSADGDATLMLIQYEPDDADNPKYDSIAKVNAVKEVLDNEHFFLFGLSAVMSDTKAILQSEMLLYMVVAVGLAIIVITLTTKQWLIPAVIISTLGLAVAYNMGTNFFFGDISYVTQSIAAILQLAVTIDYSIILLDRFEEECHHTDNVRKAMAKTISYSFTALMGGASTTFFGFIALCFMSLTLGLDIGIVMAKGIVFGILTVLIIMPAIVLKFYNIIYKYEHKRFTINFSKPIDFVIKHKKVFTTIFILLFIPAYLIQSKVTTYTDLNNKMPEDCDSYIATEKLSKDFGMRSIHFVIINDEIPSGEVNQMVKKMEKVEGIKSVISLNGFLGAGISEDIVPDSIKSICEKGGYRLMAIMSSYDLSDKYSNGDSKLSKQKTELTSIVKSYDSKGCVTGENILYDELVTIADRDFKVTNAISIAAVFILIAIAFKSLLIPVILVSAIELAIFINISVATVTGTEICFISPIVLGCVQLGATVDYAILLTSRFQEELRKGKEKTEAMSLAAKAASKSIFQSSVIFFCATIGVMFVCNLELVGGLCELLARGALISAAVIIFFVTPVLLCFEGAINKTSFDWRINSGRKFFDFMKRGKKTVNKKKVLQSVMSLVLCISLIAGLSACGKKEDDNVKETPTPVSYENQAKNVTKTETVYVNLNTDGKRIKTTVTDWLHTDSPKVRVYDKTDLNVDDIVNVKGDNLPVANQNNPNEIMWNMDTTDLYYTAETTKQLPLDIGVKYYLNGQEMTAEEIAGKGGEVKIEFNFSNNYSKAVKVNGKNQKMYLPMLVIGGLILPESKFSSISTKNGKAVGDGTNEIVALYSLPGVSESLSITRDDLEGYGDIELNNKASVTATTEKFEIENMYFAAIPIASLDLDFDATGQVDTLQGALSVLKALMKTIENVDVDKLMNTLSSNSQNISELSSVINDAVNVYEKNEKLINALSQTLTTENISTLKKLLEDLNRSDIQASISALTNSTLLQSLTNLTEIADDLQKAQPVLNQLSSLLSDPEVQSSLNNLDETISTLNRLQREIEKNKNLIKTLSDVMSDGNIDAISDVSAILANSDINLSDYGIVVDDTDAFVAAFEAWFEIGKDYKIFTDAHNNMKTNVAFIYMLPSISEGYVDEYNQPEEQENIPWWKKIFS